MIACHCDNAVVVAIVSSGRSKMEAPMPLMRGLEIFLARWEVSILFSYIPGVLNSAAEALSRDALSVFQRLMPRAEAAPTVFSEHLLNCLVRGQPDWTKMD